MIMKKQFIVSLSFILFSLFFLTNCGGSSGGGTNNNALNAGIQGTWDLGTVPTNPGNYVTGFKITFTSNDLTGTSGTFTLIINGQTFNGNYSITNSSTTAGTIQLTLPSNGFNGSSSIILVSFSISGNTITFSADINNNKQISETFSFSLNKQ